MSLYIQLENIDNGVRVVESNLERNTVEQISQYLKMYRIFDINTDVFDTIKNIVNESISIYYIEKVIPNVGLPHLTPVVMGNKYRIKGTHKKAEIVGMDLQTFTGDNPHKLFMYKSSEGEKVLNSKFANRTQLLFTENCKFKWVAEHELEVE